MTSPDPPEQFPPPYFGPPTTQPAQQPPLQPPLQPQPMDYRSAPPPQPVYQAAGPYPRYGVPPVVGTPSRLRVHRLWATIAQLTILADVIMHGVFVHAVSRQHTLLRRIQFDPGSVTLDQANAADHAARVASVWLIVLLLLSGIFLIVWLYRVRTDADVFDPDASQLGRGWAIGSWFVPIANLVLPFLVLRDVVRATRRYPDGSQRNGWLMPLASVWWGVWVVGGIGSRIVHLDTNGSISRLDSTLHEVIVLILVEGVAGLLAIVAIEAITRANRERWAAQPPQLGGWAGR